MGYKGNVARIPLGSLGVVTDMAPNELPIQALLDANNITLIEGVCQKAPGSRKLNPNAQLPAGVIALKDWRPNTVTQKTMAACSNGSIYYDAGVGNMAGLTTLVTGLTNLTPNSMFVEGGAESAGRPKKLFFFSFGENQIKVLNFEEDEFEDIASPNVDWDTGNFPRIGLIHRNRLHVFSGQIHYASDTGNHENFASNSLTNPVFPGEGGDFIGAYVFKGRLFAFKQGGFVYYFNDTAQDSSDWVWLKLSSKFGLSAPNAITEALNDMIAGNNTGTLTSYTATDALGDIESGDIFRAAQMENWFRNNFSTVGLSQQHCLFYEAKKLFFLTVRSAYFTYNNAMLILDLNRSGQGPRITPWIKGSPQCLALRTDIDGVERPMYGDKDGYIHFLDHENRLEGCVTGNGGSGTSYEGMFQTVHFDMSHMDPTMASVQKHFDWLKIEYRPEGDWNLMCDYFIDGKYINTVSFPMIQYDNPQLDVFMLDEDRLAQFNTESFARKLHGTGRCISFKFYNSGANQSFQVAGIMVGFRPSGQQAQKAT